LSDEITYFFLLSCFLFNFCAPSQAQFAQVNLPDKISLTEINEAKLNGVSFQLIKRKDWPSNFFCINGIFYF